MPHSGYERSKIMYNDQQLEMLWDDFSNVPMNPETEEIEESWMKFEAGTHREDIWHWFDERHSKGVGWLMNERG
jgi:hypothetical protein